MKQQKPKITVSKDAERDVIELLKEEVEQTTIALKKEFLSVLYYIETGLSPATPSLSNYIHNRIGIIEAEIQKLEEGK